MTRAIITEIGGKTYHYPKLSLASKDAGIPEYKIRRIIETGEAYKTREGRFWCVDEELDCNDDYDYETEERIRRLR